MKSAKSPEDSVPVTMPASTAVIFSARVSSALWKEAKPSELMEAVPTAAVAVAVSTVRAALKSISSEPVLKSVMISNSEALGVPPVTLAPAVKVKSSAPAPPVKVSWPAPPLITSALEPPVMMLLPASPVTVRRQ